MHRDRLLTQALPVSRFPRENRRRHTIERRIYAGLLVTALSIGLLTLIIR